VVTGELALLARYTSPTQASESRPEIGSDVTLKIHTYILRQLLVAFLFAVGALLFVALPGIAVNTVHKLPNVDAGILLRFLPIILQSLAPYVLPLCFMLSTVAVFGRLAADKEWIGIHMAGIHPLKTLVSPAIVAGLLGLLTFWMVSNELPQLKKRQKRFMVDATASVVENLQPGRTGLQIGDFLLKAGAREDGTFYNAYIRYLDEDQEERRLMDAFAGSVDLWIDGDFLHFKAYDFELFDPESKVDRRSEEFEAQINLAGRVERKEQSYQRAKYLVSSEIRRRLASGEVEPGREREYRFMLHYRATMFAIYFLFLLLGASTGLLMRGGTQLGALAVSAGYGILYYVLNMRLGKELGQSSDLPPWLGAWLTTIVGGAIAVVLIRRALKR